MAPAIFGKNISYATEIKPVIEFPLLIQINGFSAYRRRGGGQSIAESSVRLSEIVIH